MRDLGKAYAHRADKSTQPDGASNKLLKLNTSALYAKAASERHGFGINDPNSIAQVGHALLSGWCVLLPTGLKPQCPCPQGPLGYGLLVASHRSDMCVQ